MSPMSPLSPTTETTHPDRTSRHAWTNRLLREAQEAPAAERRRLLDDVVVANMEVATSIAARYRDRGIPLEDLEQVACLALVRAAQRFDPTRADDFLTYAVPTITGEVKRHFRDQGWTVRPPRRIQELQSRISAAARAEGDDASTEQIAARLGTSPHDVEEALAAQGCFHPTSLDQPSPAGRDSLGDRLVDDEFDDYEAVEARVILRTLTRDLSPRERLILYLRFVEGRTQGEIGAEIGVTQMQVSRLLSGILRRMRARAGDDEQVA